MIQTNVGLGLFSEDQLEAQLTLSWTAGTTEAFKKQEGVQGKKGLRVKNTLSSLNHPQ